MGPCVRSGLMTVRVVGASGRSADFHFVHQDHIIDRLADRLSDKLLVVVGRRSTRHNKAPVIQSDSQFEDPPTGFCLDGMLGLINQVGQFGW